MAGALRYDFRRTMRSRSVIISMVVMVLLSLALVPLIKLATSQTFASSGGTAVVGYSSGTEYRFLAYSYNTYGQPVIGTQVNLTVTDSGGTHNLGAVTNSSGLASWTLAAGQPDTPVTYNLRVGGEAEGGGTLPPGLRPGEVFVVGGQTLAAVVDPADSSRRMALFMYEGPNGTLPTAYGVYYNFSALAGPGGVPEKSKMTFLGSPTAVVSVFGLPEIPLNATSVTIAAFASDGSLVTASEYSTASIGGPAAPPTPEAAFTSFSSTILALVVPLMAILVAYNSYGKDRATGVLESVLARPVTWRSLGVSRYLAFVISISVALLVTMGVMELISLSLLGKAASATFAVSSVASLMVEAAAFIGIVMLLAQVVKSQGNMLLVAAGLWILLDFFWSVLTVLAASVTGVQVGSGNFLGLTIQSSFFNPAQFYTLVGDYLNGISVSTSAGGSIPISPATYGITPYTLAITAAFWVLAPLGVFLRLVSTRD